MIDGLTSMKATMGRVDNWGIEVNLNTTNIQTKDFNWGSTLTFYMNRNKLKELYGDGQDDITNSLFWANRWVPSMATKISASYKKMTPNTSQPTVQNRVT